MKTNNILALAICLAFLLSSVSGQNLLDRDTQDLFHEALSGERAKDHVIQITRHHRIQGSRGYRDAAHYVLDQLRASGFSEKDAFIESFPSDGRVVYQTWQSPSGWDIAFAELRMIEPDNERIVGYPEIAMSLITYSNPGEAIGELVWVGSGTRDSDYQKKDVKGKIVLATGYGGEVHRKAVLKYGAKAVVCYLNDQRAQEYPDMLQYTGMWPKTEELERVTFGFNITNRQGERLRRMLESGTRVVVSGTVEGIGLEPYEMDVVVATIPGSEHPDEELTFVAHLDHPKESANDNASGSGAMLDIAETLKRLIDAKSIDRPKRTLRFLWVPEWNGTMAYLDAHPEMAGPEIGGSWLASINLDMVGEHLELLHSTMIITRTPHSIPSAVNDVVENMAEMVSRMDVRTPRGSQSMMNYRVIPYSGGSDHMMFIDRKIPGIMIGHSDYTHHTSDDTPDKVDPVELERAELIATSAIWYLSNLTPSEGIELAFLAAANGARRLGLETKSALGVLKNGHTGTSRSALDEAMNRIEKAAGVEMATLASIVEFQGDPAVQRAVVAMQHQIDNQYQNARSALEVQADGINSSGVKEQKPLSDRRVPFRRTRGPLDFGLPQSKLGEMDAAWYATSEFSLNGSERFELVNFIDGVRTVDEIRDHLCAQFRPLKLQGISRYLDDLVKVGVVGWKN